MDRKYIDLFWSRVTKHSGNGCWIWTGAPGSYGYGRAQVAPRQTALAHRASWVMANGAIQADVCVLHHCDTPLCVRPDHLFVGDRSDNARDMAAKGRAHLQRNPRAFAGDRHWKRRHPELIKKKPPRPCANCGQPTTVIRRGRCTPCAQYFRKHDVERPQSLYLNARRTR